MKYLPHLVFLFCMLVSPDRFADAASWKCKAVDKLGCESTIAVTADGRPHVVYVHRASRGEQGDQIRYSCNDETAWRTEELIQDWTNLGWSHPSLVLDPTGNPRVAYGSPNDKLTYYLYNDGAGWISEVADSNPYSFEVGASLKLGSTSRGFISCVWCGNALLRYLDRTDSGWQVMPVDDPDKVPSNAWTSLALDGAYHPHIAYGQGKYEDKDHNLRHAWWDGTTWAHETIDADGDVGAAYSPLVIDPNGKIQVAYYRFGDTYDLMYAWKDGGAWSKETVQADAGGGGPPSRRIHPAAPTLRLPGGSSAGDCGLTSRTASATLRAGTLKRWIVTEAG